MSSGYVRSFDSVAERMAAPQESARTRLGQPVTQTGMILPYGRGGYRHSFGGCGCAGSMGAVGDTGMSSTMLVILLGGGALLAYTLFK